MADPGSEGSFAGPLSGIASRRTRSRPVSNFPLNHGRLCGKTPADSIWSLTGVCCFMAYIEGHAREQALLLPVLVEDYVGGTARFASSMRSWTISI
ncbi:hypothetical protein [Sphingomonas nostoxanthinifaciens]|uniref:hypothetical protein n=1 Tax=Sphingomonas nostoxanthinifaciens TaxID=2872652 RepID=UPI001CC1F02A|nr:hypothetical protein [Sphingomonas nostoxanthinifaciens]UAK25532.1 hypothetical protein K8P63_05055 [Sphingomonas nostoxanthinifaciens]